MLQLAVVCDFAEEGWASMDLVSDMLVENLQRAHSMRVCATRLQPAMKRRATVGPYLRDSKAAWKFDRLWNRMVEYPRWLQPQIPQFDVFHIVDHSYSQLARILPARRTVVTCHDLDLFRCLMKGEAENALRPRWFKAMAARVLGGLQSARHVVFVTEAMYAEAHARGLIQSGRSSVVHNGADGTADGLAGEAAEQEVALLLGDMARSPLLLSVGTTVPRKRVDVLLRVFDAVSQVMPAVRLVRAGGAMTADQQALARELGVTSRMIEVPTVPRPVLRALYRRATLLLQTSEAEGFGLPVAEAMVQGCPVVASDLATLREVGGAAATYCPVGDVPAWTAAVTDLLRESARNATARRERCLRAADHAQRFTWRESTAQMTRIYERVAFEADCERRSSLADKKRSAPMTMRARGASHEPPS